MWIAPPDDLPAQIQAYPRAEAGGIAAQLAWRVRHLPRLHADPFDQMLISKVLCERLT
jgi:PIN domain nuclease of toxin-antitoxin system